MANPSGTNQFGGFAREPGYGQVKRTAELERSAPMSGAPLATSATEAPRRAKRRGQKRGAGAASVAQPMAAPAPSVTPDAEVAAIGQELALDPESSDLLRQIVQQGG